jgi:hypothetical protein
VVSGLYLVPYLEENYAANALSIQRWLKLETDRLCLCVYVDKELFSGHKLKEAFKQTKPVVTTSQFSLKRNVFFFLNKKSLEIRTVAAR